VFKHLNSEERDIAQIKKNGSYNIDTITKDKLEGVLHKLKNGKVHGLDGINLEMFNLGGILLKP
jgi:hypothetical protein